MFFPNDSRTVLSLTSGYHHYIDTGICANSDENKIFIIDGAVVRLIRFGTSITTTYTSKVYNITVVVNSGELWYFNTSYEIDEFHGALTAIFNNGTYTKFLADYSIRKITPRLGRFIVDSPDCEGMKILPTETPGYFVVSGGLTAYSVHPDGKSARYSRYSYMSLPEGYSKIHYTKEFSTSLLPNPQNGKIWHDCGNGTVVLTEKNAIKTFYVDSNCSDGGDGTGEKPFCNLDQATANLKNGGNIIIRGSAVFSTLRPHDGVITYMGEDSDCEIVFDKNIHYYLQGDTVFKNITLSMNNGGSDKTQLVTNGYRLTYGENVKSTSIYSGTGGGAGKSDVIDIVSASVLKKNIPPRLASKGCGFLYCGKGTGTVTYQNKQYEMTFGDALVIPSAALCKMDFDEGAAVLAVNFTAPKMEQPKIPKLIKNIVASYLGDYFSGVFTDGEQYIDDYRLPGLSTAIEHAAGFNLSKRALAQRVEEYIEQNFSTESNVERISDTFHVNRSYLERAYKKAYGIGIKQSITKKRCNAAKVLLKKGYSIKEVAIMLGYKNTAAFSKAYKNETGVTPMHTKYAVTH